MKEFEKLVEITDTLNGPKGCPWDKEQTFQSLRPHVLEEVHELLEAIDEDSTEGMVEELGDILFQIVFFGKLGEKSGRFNLQEVARKVGEKLIRRHPHVFGDAEAKDASEVIHHWERVKAEEKKERKHPLEGIPKTLGALARAQKIVGKMIHKKIPFPKKELATSLGDQLLDLVIQAQEEGVDAESALRTALKRYEALFKS
ncbi:MazG family protein [Candidatus Neptunochlamydia vexilliferae]|nr:MazG family protein [Candidatus Neptunochlamydia vexilliferae]